MEKRISELKNIYAVTDKGVVYSYTKKDRLQRKPVLDKDGYETMNFRFRKDNVTVCRKVHRLVAEAFLPNSKNLPQVNHKDGNKRNNNVANLEWCTNASNYKHMLDNNLKEKGKKYLNNTSGFYGVTGKNGRFTAQVKRKKNIFLGSYSTPEEAYDVVIKELSREKEGLPIRRFKKFKCIKQIDRDNNIVNTFNTIAEAEKHTGIVNQSISHVINGKLASAGGFTWERNEVEGLFEDKEIEHYLGTCTIPKQQSNKKEKDH